MSTAKAQARKSCRESFGKEVRRQRLALGLMTEQLAKRAGLVPKYVRAIESGRHNPSLSTVLALARGLRVPAHVLIGKKMRKISAASIKAAKLFESLPPNVQNGILIILRYHVQTSLTTDGNPRTQATR